MNQPPSSVVRLARSLGLKLLSEVSLHYERSREMPPLQEMITAEGVCVHISIEPEEASEAQEGNASDEGMMPDWVNKMMSTICQQVPEEEYVGWTRAEWAKRLSCSESAVQRCEMWQAIKRLREARRTDLKDRMRED